MSVYFEGDFYSINVERHTVPYNPGGYFLAYRENGEVTIVCKDPMLRMSMERRARVTITEIEDFFDDGAGI